MSHEPENSFDDKAWRLEQERFETKRADSVEMQLEEVLRLVGLSRRDWDNRKNSYNAMSAWEFLQERLRDPQNHLALKIGI